MTGHRTHSEDPQTRSTAVAVAEVASDVPSPLKHLRGLAVPYNSPTLIGPFWESFAPGAFAESIRHTPGLPLLTYHDDKADPIGVSVDWQENRAGLVGLWRLDGSDRAQEAARLVRDGMLNFLSIRFQQDSATDVWTVRPDGYESVVRHKARLIEVSLVSTPAYADAKVIDVRAHPQEVTDLAVRLGLDMSRSFTGTTRQQRVAAGLVGRYVDEYGRGAIPRLFEDAAVARDGMLAVNMTLAAETLKSADPATLRAAQTAEFRALVKDHQQQRTEPPRRRRRGRH